MKNSKSSPVKPSATPSLSPSIIDSQKTAIGKVEGFASDKTRILGEIERLQHRQTALGEDHSGEILQLQTKLLLLTPEFEAAKGLIPNLTIAVHAEAGRNIGAGDNAIQQFLEIRSANAIKRVSVTSRPAMIDYALLCDSVWHEDKLKADAIKPPFVGFDTVWVDVANPIPQSDQNHTIPPNKNEPDMRAALVNPLRDAKRIALFHEESVRYKEKAFALLRSIGGDPEAAPVLQPHVKAAPRHLRFTPKGEEGVSRRIILECLVSTHVGVLDGEHISLDAGDRIDLPWVESPFGDVEFVAGKLAQLTRQFRVIGDIPKELKPGFLHRMFRGNAA